MNISTMLKLKVALMVLAISSGCMTLTTQENPPVETTQPPPKEIEPEKPVEPTVSVDAASLLEQELKQAIEVYWEGRYEEAIAKLTPLPSATELPLSSQIKAIKFMAFSNCVIGRLSSCKKNFATALMQDPTFRLDAAEKGHPVWGRQFELALAESQKKSEAMNKPKQSPGVAKTSPSETQVKVDKKPLPKKSNDRIKQ